MNTSTTIDDSHTGDQLREAITSILSARLRHDYSSIVPMTHEQIAHLIVASRTSLSAGIDYVSLYLPDSFPQSFPFTFKFEFDGPLGVESNALDRGIAMLELATGTKAHKVPRRAANRPTPKGKPVPKTKAARSKSKARTPDAAKPTARVGKPREIRRGGIGGF